MSIVKKGSRPITVDGQKYRWQVRRFLTEAQGCEDSSMNFTVELFTKPGAVLVVDTNRLRLDAWITMPSESHAVTPSEVAVCIRDAIAAGWLPAKPGSAFRLQEQLKQP